VRHAARPMPLIFRGRRLLSGRLSMQLLHAVGILRRHRGMKVKYGLEGLVDGHADNGKSSMAFATLIVRRFDDVIFESGATLGQ
jgi:hypothetical protein